MYIQEQPHARIVLVLFLLSSQTISGFDSSRHLAWGDVAIDDLNNPQSLRVHLKHSKIDQLGKGIGKTDCPLCPVTAVMTYMASRGPDPGPFLS